MPAATCSSPSAAGCLERWPGWDYDLAATLDCGQAFRWTNHNGSWTGVVHERWVRLSLRNGTVGAETALPQTDWAWLADYLQIHVNLGETLSTFPDDEPMRAAVTACRGLRLLRQDPWECLVSFLLSATKQITQIRQVIALLCEEHGAPLPVPPAEAPAFGFPSAERIAALAESDLRRLRMGFRAPHVLGAARAMAEGRLDLPRLATLSLPEARERLLQLDGVGPKIADCVLLFGCGFPHAFPVDVWVERALRELYFRGRPVSLRQLREFAAGHFGPNAGYAQQYLFHHARTRAINARREAGRLKRFG